MQWAEAMVRSVLVLMAVAAAPAWAVGERVALPKSGPEFTEQLRESLCISMECGVGVDATLTAKVVKGKAEIKVMSSTGALKATITAPLNDAGRMSSMDLVSATSGIISAIESPEPSSKAPAAKKKVAAKAKKSSYRFAAKTRAAHSRG